MPQHFHVHTGTSVQALMELHVLSREQSAQGTLRASLDRIGDPTGETWLHLLGLCLELGQRAALEHLVDHIERMPPLLFREILLGSTAWSWHSIVGRETIQDAARGDQTSQRALLDDDRYYGGSPRESLSRVMPLDPDETKQLFVETLREFNDSRDLGEKEAQLASVENRVNALTESESWIEAVETLTGYRYFPEPEARTVAIVPHLADDSLSLTQHEETRLIVFGVRPPVNFEERLIEIAKALADENRIRIIKAVSERPRQLGELLESSGLTRSTIHHHLRTLRAAGLVTVQGNAHNYRYALSKTGTVDAIQTISELLDASQEKGNQ